MRTAGGLPSAQLEGPKEGLRNSTTAGSLGPRFELDDSLTFEAIKAELSLREQAYGETFEQAVSCNEGA